MAAGKAAFFYRIKELMFEKPSLNSKHLEFESGIGTLGYVRAETFGQAWEAADINRPTIFDVYSASGDRPTAIGGNRYFGLEFKNETNNYGFQICCGFGEDKIAIRRRKDSLIFSEWKYFTAT